MLKGTLEGIVLAILSGEPAYGYEITAWLREQGFSDIAEETIDALLVRIEQRGLVDVEKTPSEKGPPRKMYSLNAQGQEYLKEFWSTWSASRNGSNSSTKETDNHVHLKVHLKGDRRQVALAAVQGAHTTTSRELSHRGRGAGALPELLREGRRRDCDVRGDRPVRTERGERNPDPPDRREDPVEFIETFVQNYPKGQWIIRERERLTNAIERAAGENTGRQERAL